MPFYILVFWSNIFFMDLVALLLIIVTTLVLDDSSNELREEFVWLGTKSSDAWLKLLRFEARSLS